MRRFDQRAARGHIQNRHTSSRTNTGADDAVLFDSLASTSLAPVRSAVRYNGFH